MDILFGIITGLIIAGNLLISIKMIKERKFMNKYLLAIITNTVFIVLCLVTK